MFELYTAVTKVDRKLPKYQNGGSPAGGPMIHVGRPLTSYEYQVTARQSSAHSESKAPRRTLSLISPYGLDLGLGTWDVTIRDNFADSPRRGQPPITWQTLRLPNYAILPLRRQISWCREPLRTHMFEDIVTSKDASSYIITEEALNNAHLQRI